MSLRPKRINFDEAFKELKRNLDKLYDFSGLDKVSGMYMHEYPFLHIRSSEVHELAFIRFNLFRPTVSLYSDPSCRHFCCCVILDFSSIGSYIGWCMKCVMHLLNHIQKGCLTRLQSSWKIVQEEPAWYE
jgi:hypothetical protein